MGPKIPFPGAPPPQCMNLVKIQKYLSPTSIGGFQGPVNGETDAIHVSVSAMYCIQNKQFHRIL
jgi:hypothetical protein